MLYAAKDLEKAFDPDVLRQSRPLLERGGMGQPNVARGGALLTALIRTIEAPPPRVYIRIETKGDQGVSIKAECNCPQRRMCHHATAVLLKVLEDDRSVHLAGNTGTANTLSGQGASAGRRLVYILQAPGEGKQGIRLRLQVARVLDDGRYGDTWRFISASLSFSAPPGFLLADDLVLMGQLKERCSNDRDSLDIRDGWLSLPAARLKPILQTLFEIYEPKSLDHRGRMQEAKAEGGRGNMGCRVGESILGTRTSQNPS